ncbi:MAG: hypothetical protein V8R75_07710 [Oscillospiraceae bacterium]
MSIVFSGANVKLKRQDAKHPAFWINGKPSGLRYQDKSWPVKQHTPKAAKRGPALPPVEAKSSVESAAFLPEKNKAQQNSGKLLGSVLMNNLSSTAMHF